MRPHRVAFVGFGEVASVFSGVMRENGADVSVYDVNLDRPGGLERLRKRVRAEGIEFRPLAEAVRGAGYVLSTVRSQTAEEAARTCVPCLGPGQVYVDLNSTAPSTKLRLAETIRPSGALFVEGAILGAVGASGAATHILVSGEGADDAAYSLRGLGLNVSFYGTEIGRASRFKMLRSIFSKGLEALILELMIAATRAGIREDLWKDIVGFMMENPFDRVASNWVRTHPGAHERRHHEMVQVIEAIREMGLDPVMTSATESFFRRSCGAGLKEAFPEKPGAPEQVAEFLERWLGENGRKRK